MNLARPRHPLRQGLRANLLRLYGGISEESFAECRAAGKYQKLLFALTYFHSVLLERRKFRALGLNIPYDFNDTDYKVRGSGGARWRGTTCYLERSIFDSFLGNRKFRALGLNIPYDFNDTDY